PYWAGENGAHTAFADLGPLLVVSQASLDDLNARRAARGVPAVPIHRFRPNIVIDGVGAFAEDQIQSLQLTRSSTRVGLVKPCARCTVINTDQETAVVTKDATGPLEMLAMYRAAKNRRGSPGVMFGQNAMVTGATPAEVKVGDRLSQIPLSPMGERVG